mgnify:CR=1 FL=1
MQALPELISRTKTKTTTAFLSPSMRTATLTVANPERIAHMTTGMGMTKRVSSGSFTKSQPTSPYEEYESIKLTGFYDTFDEAFGKMKELIAESVNDVFDEDATADDVEDMEDYNVFVHSNKYSQDNGAPLAFASFCDDYPNREWTVFHI